VQASRNKKMIETGQKSSIPEIQKEGRRRRDFVVML
jgi:hypothetical protein